MRFDRPGIVRVFCDIHSHMNAFVLVFSHPFFALTDADGRYRIDNVPPGTYSVIAWNEGDAPSRGRDVPDGGLGRAGLHAAMKRAVVAAQPDLSGERDARGALHRRRHLPRQRPRHEEAERTLQREIVAAAALVDNLRTTRTETFTQMARFIAERRR